ncbi:methyltransferase, FxLD system [Actinoplanes sp. NBC_00393]|uniref:methyltransferase, FxLD system n=1 Tax=Actinoplanes sp. NBC_00393 TaxID=2975953 RepID=UPI002E2074CD
MVAAQMYDALDDFAAAGQPLPADLYQRFVSWTRRAPLASVDHHMPATERNEMENKSEERAGWLREAMVVKLREQDAIVSDEVAAAFAAVPRHQFAPGEPLERSYDLNVTLAPKTLADGTETSVVSAAEIQAAMLEQTQIEPGMNVLEIGSGGYNAALIAELVGPTGWVTTVDIDADITARAAAYLRQSGYGRVSVVTADAEHGVPDHAPFDRIIVTVGAWDIPPAWIEQLTETGRIVVPLRFAGITRIIAFDRAPGSSVLTAASYRLGAFVPMQGDGATQEQLVAITPDVALRLDPQQQARFDIPALRKAIHEPGIERWSGTAFDMPDELQLFLLTNGGPQMPMLHVSQAMIDQDVFQPSARLGVPVLIAGGSFAYRTKRTNPQTSSGYETGVIAHGPDAEQVANRLLELIRDWARDHFLRGSAHIAYHPAGADATGPAGWNTVKRHGTLAVTWS